MEAQGKLRGDDSGKYSVDRAMAQLHFAWFLPCTEEPTGQHPVRMKVGKGSVNNNRVCEDAGLSSELASSFSSLAQRHSDSVGDDGELAADNACAEVAQTASNRGGRWSASG